MIIISKDATNNDTVLMFEDSYANSNITLFHAETVCDRHIPNGHVSDECDTQVGGDSCDAFTCDYGYNETKDVGSFNCTEDGSWDYNVSLLCVGRFI